ncbi:metal ABC transporter ATP-binding protein [Luteolibacter sp. GHJ8]|uniref:Metal ABC transporter ATP-binding protein n=1 Tax=Luteolibacter rhizosphaerae TaxID=2989719 RepID=A0ABT3G331_9BACT|nr:metal ABC transporter ATP-binding protein [Luteolibacter rhizosphaerae]MCW1914246.1 metal ABC transporter ATP-binding protein [Luteolibacter rhizosphaerae]
MSEEHHDCCAHHSHHHELVIDSLQVRYRNTLALDGVSFATSCGNRVALVGPNGAGKSTLLKAIAGLVPRSGGTISWRRTAVKRWSREFAYLPQREEVDWSFPITVRGLVEMGRYPQTGIFGRFGDADHAAVENALQSLDLLDLQKRQIRELSGGQQQRAFLARAIAQEAHVLLLDEPFTGLDRNASRQLGDLLERLAHEGRLVVASHHDLATVPKLFDEALLLKTRPIAFGTAEEALSAKNLDRAFGHITDAEDRAAPQLVTSDL